MQASPGVTTLLFTDIEGSTRLWEQEGERMSRALARHDALSRAAVEGNGGIIVKMTGDGMYAAFDDPLDALNATLALQQSLGDPRPPTGSRSASAAGCTWASSSGATTTSSAARSTAPRGS